MEIHVLGVSAFIAQVKAINKTKELCHLLFREDLNDGWCFEALFLDLFTLELGEMVEKLTCNIDMFK